MGFERTFRTVWLWGLAFFMVAGLTGFLYRYGMTGSLPFELGLNNVRHAHSHLMFFNWVTPIPMLFIAKFVVSKAPMAAKAFKRCIYTVFILGFASYPFFLTHGYQPVMIGEASLPFSVIFSGLVMIAWYWFFAIYLRHREQTEPGMSRFFYEASMVMLFISSLGAWGVAVFQFSSIDNPLLSSSFTHFFLTVFTEGWCILSALGMIYGILKPEKIPFSRTWLVAPVLLGVPLMFPFGISVDLLTTELLISARIGALMVTAGLILNLFVLLKYSRESVKWWWTVVVVLLAAKVLLQLGSVLLPTSFWIGQHGLRVLYLHLILLGFVSITYFSAWHSLKPKVSQWPFTCLTVSIILVLGSLVMISGYWPSGLQPEDTYSWVLWISLFPSLIAAWEWWNVFSSTGSGAFKPDLANIE